jgi:hypothetical protein
MTVNIQVGTSVRKQWCGCAKKLEHVFLFLNIIDRSTMIHPEEMRSCRTMFRPISARASYALIASLFYTAALLAAPFLCAQTLPQPSRTMYKCKVQGTTTYSDSPCLGATKLEVVPTRGISKLSGRDRIGNDVFLERQHETFAEGIRPLTGMDAKQLATATRRNQLSPAGQQECRQLDQSLPTVEDEEKRAVQPVLRDVQARLFLMRKRFRELRC